MPLNAQSFYVLTDYKSYDPLFITEAKELEVFMTIDYCSWCRKLENRILSQEHIKHIPLILNYDEKKFPKNLGKITVTPTLYVLDVKTQKIKEIFVGFSSRKLFLNYLSRIHEK